MSDAGSEAMRDRLSRLVIAEATYGDLLRQCRARAPIMLRLAREAFGCDAEGLADRLGVSESHVVRIERGEDLPGYETLQRLQRIWEAATPPTKAGS